MTKDQAKAYNYGWSDAKAGNPRWDVTNYSIRHYSEFPSEGSQVKYYDYWLKGYDDYKSGTPSQTTAIVSAGESGTTAVASTLPAIPSDTILEGMVKTEYNRIKRPYTDDIIKTWIVNCRSIWRQLGKDANQDKLLNELIKQIDALPPINTVVDNVEDYAPFIPPSVSATATTSTPAANATTATEEKTTLAGLSSNVWIVIAIVGVFLGMLFFGKGKK
jgi:hypothetical protein